MNMVKQDWKGILIQSENRTEIYRGIFQKLNINDVAEIKSSGWSQVDAKKVGEVVRLSSKKPLVIGRDHHLMACVGNCSVDYVYFDAHSDDNRGEWNNLFTCATFINYMEGQHYVAGVGEGIFPNGEKTVWFRHNEADKIVEVPFRDNIFLSYDIDVFHPSVTTAHEWGESGRMFPQQVKDLSNRIVGGRNLVGMNVASYNPCKEAHQNYKTVDVIIDLLRPLIETEKVGDRT